MPKRALFKLAEILSASVYVTSTTFASSRGRSFAVEMSCKCAFGSTSSGSHLFNSSLQFARSVGGATMRAGQSSEYAASAAMACTVFPSPISSAIRQRPLQRRMNSIPSRWCGISSPVMRPSGSASASPPIMEADASKEAASAAARRAMGGSGSTSSSTSSRVRRLFACASVMRQRFFFGSNAPCEHSARINAWKAEMPPECLQSDLLGSGAMYTTEARSPNSDHARTRRGAEGCGGGGGCSSHPAAAGGCGCCCGGGGRGGGGCCSHPALTVCCGCGARGGWSHPAVGDCRTQCAGGRCCCGGICGNSCLCCTPASARSFSAADISSHLACLNFASSRASTMTRLTVSNSEGVSGVAEPAMSSVSLLPVLPTYTLRNLSAPNIFSTTPSLSL
mmetsp:Transcript_10636/g.26819  ORF Transcript_10636/g.26819 Transcript_10636/m.26819 type:complete len:393 (-) Transcript_10636:255-1433(-)